MRQLKWALMVLALASPAGAMARDSWLEGSAALSFGMNSSSASEEGISDIRNQGGVSGALTYGHVLPSGDELRLGAELGLEGYPGASDLNRFGYGLTAEYRTDLSDAAQLRLSGSLDGKHDENGEVFGRIRGGAMLRYREGREHLSWARLRLGYRDQNEANTFEGYDQGELLVELGHDWRPRGDRQALIGTVYGDFRSADASQYSYQEYGIRLIARQPVRDDLEVSLRLNAFTRQYDDLFSATYPVDRHDERLRAVVQADYRLSEAVTLSGYAGWERNASNVPVRAYDGPVAGVVLTVDKTFWQK